ncbi:MAG TPA: hypothetical protein VI072_06015 [Polyangiaceae bacterium]
MATQKPAQGELAELLTRMQHLQAEHTPLLDKIEADAGMSRDVRSALVEHLNQEEDELRAKIALLSPGSAARNARERRALPGDRESRADAPASGRATSAGARLTIGSLRCERVPLTPRTRASAAASATRAAPVPVPSGSGARSSIGSLRRR